jgi:quercetin dioxygenase-like cupin family protein
MKPVNLASLKQVKISNRHMVANEQCAETIQLPDGSAAVHAFSLPKGFTVPEHAHPETRIVFFRAGSAQYTLGQKSVRARTGDCISILPGLSHCHKVGPAQPLSLVEVAIHGQP